jgi:antirestriction protein ArdC
MPIENHHSDLFSQLEIGITRLTSSDAWRDHLTFQSRFHRYSYGNVLLIASQDRWATQVAGFHTWRRLNRRIRKGEKAIWILAPMVAKRRASFDGDDGDDDDSGGGREKVIRGFKFVPVFDIAQTVGEDPPTISTRLSGDDPDRSYDRFLAVARSIGFVVEDHVFDGTTNGDCSVSQRRIRVDSRNSPAQRVKTLVHELAHALLHESMDDRALAELEAESTAFIVCGKIGMDTSEYSFGYVATWAGGGEQALALIKTSCQRIQKAAAIILAGQEEQEQAA